MKPVEFRQLLDAVVPGKKLEKLFIHFGNPHSINEKNMDALVDGVSVNEVIFIGKWLINNIMTFLSQLAGFSILNLEFADCIGLDHNVSIIKMIVITYQLILGQKIHLSL